VVNKDFHLSGLFTPKVILKIDVNILKCVRIVYGKNDFFPTRCRLNTMRCFYYRSVLPCAADLIMCLRLLQNFTALGIPGVAVVNQSQTAVNDLWIRANDWYSSQLFAGDSEVECLTCGRCMCFAVAHGRWVVLQSSAYRLTQSTDHHELFQRHTQCDKVGLDFILLMWRNGSV